MNFRLIVAFFLAFITQAVYSQGIPEAELGMYQERSLETHVKDWIQKSYPKAVSAREAAEISREIIKTSIQSSLKVDLLVGLVAVESGFNPRAMSPSGAKGLTQVVPRWHKAKIRGRNLHDPKVAIEVGAKVLRDCMDKGKTTARALACYSGYTGTAVAKYKADVFAKIKNFNNYVDVARIARDPIIVGSVTDPLDDLVDRMNL